MADLLTFNVTIRFQHCNAMSTLANDMGFLFPPEFGPGVGTLQQQRHGWISFQLPLTGNDRWAAAKKVSRMVRLLRDGWHLPPHLPAEEKMTTVEADPGFRNDTLPWGPMRLVTCSVCNAVYGAATALEGNEWMLKHPGDHTPQERALLGDGTHHYQLLKA